MLADILNAYIEKLGPVETEEMRETRALISVDESDFEVLRVQVRAYADAIQQAVDALEDSERKLAILGQSLILVVLYDEIKLPEFYEEALHDAYVYAYNMSSGDDIYLEVQMLLERRG